MTENNKTGVLARTVSRIGLGRGLFIGSSVAFALVAAACSDDPAPGAETTDGGADTSVTKPDTGSLEDGGAEDGATEDVKQPLVDSGNDASTGPSPVFFTFPSGSHSRLYNVVHTAAGIYATGQVTSITAPTDFAIPLVKILPTGVLDTTFGNNGIVTTNTTVGGLAGELGRGIVVQSSGKIIVAGTSDHVVPSDATRDIVVMRFTAAGVLDTTFGPDNTGIKRIVLGTGESVAHYGLNVLANDDLIVTGSRKPATGAGNEFVVIKLKGTDGSLDTSFGGPASLAADAGTEDAGAPDGIFSIAIGTNINSRFASVLADGSIVAAGYVALASGAANKPFIFKLTPAGKLDKTFNGTGVYFPESGVEGFTGTGGIAESYQVIPQGDKLVTTGYGRDNDSKPAIGFLSLRLNANGTRDLTYGTGGFFYLGLNAQPAQSRAIALLADSRLLFIGGASPAKPSADAGTQTQQAAIAITSPDGVLDTTFSTGGPRLYDLGGPATGRNAHFFWGVSLSPDKKNAAIVGIKGGISTGDAGVAGNDQAVFLYLPTGN